MEQVNISEASRRLGVSRKTIHRRIDAGELAAVDTPHGRRVLLPRESGVQAHTPDAHSAHVRAQSDAQGGAHPPPASETEGKSGRMIGIHMDRDDPTEDSAYAAIDLQVRLERAESRIDHLLTIVGEQNRTIQAQTIRLAQLEGRMLDHSTPDTLSDMPEMPPEPRQAPADIHTPPRRRRGLRELYRVWRGR
ncbi:MAG: excisionase family DNA-binding protein [Chloroflexota bacterium]|nr:excisionase family DNA-binding protein [Chloroflexota bacterium]